MKILIEIEDAHAGALLKTLHNTEGVVRFAAFVDNNRLDFTGTSQLLGELVDKGYVKLKTVRDLVHSIYKK